MQFVVRVAQKNDEESLWQMLYYAARMAEDGAQNYHAAKTHPDLHEYVADWGQATDIGVVALVAERIVGAAWARPVQHETIVDVPVDHHEIAIAVHPDFHGQGMGATLMSGLNALADMRHIDLALTVREGNPAIRLYQRAGFVVTEEIVNRVGGKSLVMQRKRMS
ncbi:MAG: N-acetyltransferase [Chloroflexi bacterium]|nr:MAG: N-acetyltransferase [Chloroflexota bacterium]